MTIIAKLARLHIITPRGLATLAGSFMSEGVSIMALLRFAARYYPDRCAVVEGERRLTYEQMYARACRLARILLADYGLKAGMRVALMCRNHVTLTLLLPALSRLGVAVKLLNTGMAARELHDLVGIKGVDLLVVDAELNAVAEGVPCTVVETDALAVAAFDDDRRAAVPLPRTCRGGDISVFTGGSGGRHKEAPRKMRIAQFLPPLFALLERINIDAYDSVCLPLPLYHGFGLATLVVSLLMGKKVCLMKRFDTAEALRLIDCEKVEVLPVVPAMLARLWQCGEAPAALRSVKCVISGGDRLDRRLVDVTTEHLGHVVYNLYGTSEAGFFMLATPADLLAGGEVTIGRPICGVRCKVVGGDDTVGELWVRSGWAMTGLRCRWQNTGDLVSRDADGYYYYRGRKDNMVVCGGENVYPEAVERVINEHPAVVASRVVPVHDPQYGTVLTATVELAPSTAPTAASAVPASPLLPTSASVPAPPLLPSAASVSASLLTSDALREWLRPRLSRAEMPHTITIAPVSTTTTGKPLRSSQ